MRANSRGYTQSRGSRLNCGRQSPRRSNSTACSSKTWCLRALADTQAVRLEQWNQRLEQLVAERTAELEQANASLHRGLLDSVRLLLTFLERRLPARATRCREIARLGGRLAERAGLSHEQGRWVQIAALVHDIGLVALSDELLRRTPSLLPPLERAQYERHPIIGQTMLGSVQPLAEMSHWIRYHHERWDGSGYPDRLVGSAIPLVSRIIALVDGFLEAAAREGGTAILWRREQRHTGAFDPMLLTLLDDELRGRPTKSTDSEEESEQTTVHLHELNEGWTLTEPIRTATGVVLLQAGEVLTTDHIERLHRLLASGAVLAANVAIAAARASDD